MHPHRIISRRQLLRTSASTLLAASLWPGALHAADQKAGDFHFFVLNDLHYLTDECHPFFQSLITQLKSTAKKADFCLIAGDLADNGKPAQIAPVRDLFKSLGMPLHVVCGNHDGTKQEGYLLCHAKDGTIVREFVEFPRVQPA